MLEMTSELDRAAEKPALMEMTPELDAALRAWIAAPEYANGADVQFAALAAMGEMEPSVRDAPRVYQTEVAHRIA